MQTREVSVDQDRWAVHREFSLIVRKGRGGLLARLPTRNRDRLVRGSWPFMGLLFKLNDGNIGEIDANSVLKGYKIRII